MTGHHLHGGCVWEVWRGVCGQEGEWRVWRHVRVCGGVCVRAPRDASGSVERHPEVNDVTTRTVRLLLTRLELLIAV